MTGDRFFLLLKFLSFTTKSVQQGQQGYKLHKIKSAVSHFNDTFTKVKLPEDITIDESMVGFLGRTPHLRQFMPQKRHARFGIKLWCLCNAKDGYTATVEVYQGANGDISGSTYDLVFRYVLYNYRLDEY